GGEAVQHQSTDQSAAGDHEPESGEVGHDESREVDCEDADGRDYAEGEKNRLAKPPTARLVAAAAGLGATCVVAGIEGVTARAGVDGVGVVHGEAGTHQAVHVVDLGALDVGRAEVVDQDLHALGLAHEVL